MHACIDWDTCTCMDCPPQNRWEIAWQSALKKQKCCQANMTTIAQKFQTIWKRMANAEVVTTNWFHNFVQLFIRFTYICAVWPLPFLCAHKMHMEWMEWSDKRNWQFHSFIIPGEQKSKNGKCQHTQIPSAHNLLAQVIHKLVITAVRIDSRNDPRMQFIH